MFMEHDEHKNAHGAGQTANRALERGDPVTVVHRKCRVPEFDAQIPARSDGRPTPRARRGDSVETTPCVLTEPQQEQADVRLAC